MDNTVTLKSDYMFGAKLKDRRVEVYTLENEDAFILFRKRTDDLRPRSSHKVVRDKIVETGLVLSLEASKALKDLLEEHIARLRYKKLKREYEEYEKEQTIKSRDNKAQKTKEGAFKRKSKSNNLAKESK